MRVDVGNDADGGENFAKRPDSAGHSRCNSC